MNIFELFPHSQPSKVLSKADQLDASDVMGVLVANGLAIVLPFLFIYYLDYCRISWGVQGGASTILKESLLRKYLYYDEVNKINTISVAEFTNCINKDTSVLAQDGYMQLFNLAASVGKLVMLFAFQVYLAVDLGEPIVYPSREFARLEFRRNIWLIGGSARRQLSSLKRAVDMR